VIDSGGDALEALESGPAFRLGELAASPCSRSTGVYTLWDEGVFLYVGIARVDPSETTNPQAEGIKGRLNTYRRSRLTNDFPVKVFLRFIVPRLTQEQLNELGAGHLGMDEMGRLTRRHIDERITFRAFECEKESALALEKQIRKTGLPHCGVPAFNPL
jgi:hypothetical protein